MNSFDHDLIVIGAASFFAFLSARAGSRSKADAARIAELEQKMDRVLSQLGGTGYNAPPGYNVPPANNPAAGIGSAYSVSATGDILDLIRRGKKIEAIKLYRTQNPGADLLTAKNAVEQMERGGP